MDPIELIYVAETKSAIDSLCFFWLNCRPVDRIFINYRSLQLLTASFDCQQFICVQRVLIFLRTLKFQMQLYQKISLNPSHPVDILSHVPSNFSIFTSLDLINKTAAFHDLSQKMVNTSLVVGQWLFQFGSLVPYTLNFFVINLKDLVDNLTFNLDKNIWS